MELITTVFVVALLLPQALAGLIGHGQLRHSHKARHGDLWKSSPVKVEAVVPVLSVRRAEVLESRQDPADSDTDSDDANDDDETNSGEGDSDVGDGDSDNTTGGSLPRPHRSQSYPKYPSTPNLPPQSNAPNASGYVPKPGASSPKPAVSNNVPSAPGYAPKPAALSPKPVGLNNFPSNNNPRPAPVPASKSAPKPAPKPAELNPKPSSEHEESAPKKGEEENSAESGTTQKITYADAFVAPRLSGVKFLGACNQQPAKKFIKHTNAEVPKLADDQLTPNTKLITDYKIWNGSGTLRHSDDSELGDIDHQLYFDRDNGKGGYLNGKKLFIYADTIVSQTDANWKFASFVSSSVAVDVGDRAKNGEPPTLQDMMGTFEGSNGNLRSFIPSTLGEAAYSNALVKDGKRFAIWPQSSIIPLDSETALLYPEISHVETSDKSQWTSLGNTLLKITVPGDGGPVAERVSPLMFPEQGLQFGTIGGIRSWGKSGPGGQDGYVYVFAGGDRGLLLGRVKPGSVADRSAYEYYDKSSKSWSEQAPSKSSDSWFVDGKYANVDIFYSPRHLTFIMVYQDAYADNKFLWRYVQTSGIKPSYAGGEHDDAVAEILNNEWTKPQQLWQNPKPKNGEYSYGGGINQGYFDEDDIVNGGTKALLQYSEPLGSQDRKGYNTNFAVVTFE